MPTMCQMPYVIFNLIQTLIVNSGFPLSMFFFPAQYNMMKAELIIIKMEEVVSVIQTLRFHLEFHTSETPSF